MTKNKNKNWVLVSENKYCRRFKSKKWISAYGNDVEAFFWQDENNEMYFELYCFGGNDTAYIHIGQEDYETLWKQAFDTKAVLDKECGFLMIADWFCEKFALEM